MFPSTPFPSPTIDAIRQMPEDKDKPELLEAKKAAARVWLRQFCGRMRFVFQTGDLFAAARRDLECARQIDKARRLLTDEEINATLRVP